MKHDIKQPDTLAAIVASIETKRRVSLAPVKDSKK